MKLIPLTRGMFAKVDDEDFEFLSQFKWTAHKAGNTYYADREVRREDGTRTTQKMHAAIMQTPKGFDTHHLNGDGLDNQKANLRVLSRSQHARSAAQGRKNKQTGFRGVYFCARNNCFAADISIHVGYFDTAEEAAKARDSKVRELGWPEEGLNFPATPLA